MSPNYKPDENYLGEGNGFCKLISRPVTTALASASAPTNRCDESPSAYQLNETHPLRPTRLMDETVDSVPVSNPKPSDGSKSRSVNLRHEVNLREDGTGIIILKKSNEQPHPHQYSGNVKLDIDFAYTLGGTSKMESEDFLQRALDIMYNEAKDDKNPTLYLDGNKDFGEPYDAPCTISTIEPGPRGAERRNIQLHVIYRGAIDPDRKPAGNRPGETAMREKYGKFSHSWVAEPERNYMNEKAKDDFRMIVRQHMDSLGCCPSEIDLAQFYNVPKNAKWKEWEHEWSYKGQGHWSGKAYAYYPHSDLYEDGEMQYIHNVNRHELSHFQPPVITVQRAREIANGYPTALWTLTKKYMVFFPWYDTEKMRNKVEYDIAFLVTRQHKLREHEIIDFYNASEYMMGKESVRIENRIMKEMLENARFGFKEEDECLNINSREEALRYWRSRRGLNLSYLPNTWKEYFPELEERYWAKLRSVQEEVKQPLQKEAKQPRYRY
ncbi:hypothetical protein ACMFMG_007103 [Clarireedia jacksonii]